MEDDIHNIDVKTQEAIMSKKEKRRLFKEAIKKAKIELKDKIGDEKFKEFVRMARVLYKAAHDLRVIDVLKTMYANDRLWAAMCFNGMTREVDLEEALKGDNCFVIIKTTRDIILIESTPFGNFTSVLPTIYLYFW